MTPATVTVEPATGGRWKVVLRNGDWLTVVGTHTARFRANEQAATLRGELEGTRP